MSKISQKRNKTSDFLTEISEKTSSHSLKENAILINVNSFRIIVKFKEKEIIIDKEVNDLDRFVLKFLNHIRHLTSYVIVSGYVAIVMGRPRATDDVDILVPKMTKEFFARVWNGLEKDGFWCLNTTDMEDAYELLKTNSIRFAIHPQITPNIELKWCKNTVDQESLKNPISIVIDRNPIQVAPLELQIAYKEIALKGNKDKEDAAHIRDVAKGFLDEDLIDAYKRALK